MSDIDITLYLNEYRVRALADALGSQTAETVEDKLTEAFDTLYQEYVPDEQRASIEATIEREDAAEQARLEAARRFAVYHIRENGDDCHFTSDYFHTPMQAAYRYRLYERGELSDAPENFAAAFIETNPVSLEYFGKVCADMDNDTAGQAANKRISDKFFIQGISPHLVTPAKTKPHIQSQRVSSWSSPHRTMFPSASECLTLTEGFSPPLR